MKRVVLAVVLVISLPAVAQSSSAPAASSNPKVRAITGFVRLDRATYPKQVTDALVVLRRAKAEFESSGYEVETVRLTTQPLAELVSGLSEEQALAFLAQLDDLSVKENFLPNVGPAMLHDSDDPAAMHCSKECFRLFQTSKAAPSLPMRLEFTGKQSVALRNS